MRNKILVCALTLAAVSTISAQDAEKKSEKKSAVQWQKGPIKGTLGNLAEIQVPAGYAFADAANSKTFMEETGNLVNGSEQGTIINMAEGWFVIFEFEETGYIKDDEKDTLDAAALLESLKKSNEAGNEERKSRGMEALILEGWHEKPHYDPSTHNLVWATVLRGSFGKSINHNMRILGRRGVMSATLVVDPEAIAGALPKYSTLISDYKYSNDNLYSSFRPGDKVAEYGLSALVLGGAAAAAVKMGFFKTIGKFLIAGWKLVAVALVGLGSAIKKLFFKPKPEEPEAVAAE